MPDFEGDFQKTYGADTRARLDALVDYLYNLDRLPKLEK
jgi:hypothetical protein